MKTKGKGSLPDKCPNCKKDDADWEYEDIQIEGDQVWQEIFCSECGSKYNEYYDLAGWELMEAGELEDD